MLKIIKKYRNPIIKYGVLFAVYIILVLFMRENINKFIDSDASSELILAQILKNNGGILTNQWCFLQAFFGQSCKTFLDIVACPNWTKLQSVG